MTDAGRLHAQKITAGLRGVSRSVLTLHLPDLPLKGDASDWLKNGGSREGLLGLVKNGVAAKSIDKPAVPVGPPTAPDPDQISIPRELNEDYLALSFARIHSENLKYCHHRGSWYQWDGSRWKIEETRLAFDWARRLCRKLNTHENKTIAKSATAASVERFAQSDRRFAVTSEIWDKDPWLLGTPGGVVSLKTGVVSIPRQADLITKQTSVAPAHQPDCPIWLQFLEEATKNDDNLVLFLRQVAGLCLTGSTREHALFFIYGPGGNGKSVFIDTIINILGDYARTAPMETFTAARQDRHPTDLAMLRGARLVTASETEEGRAWAESRIKQITGGDRIAARFMRQDFFEYTPQFKLVIIGNHKPVLRNVDDATKRRFNIIPFINAPAKPDRELEEKLKREYPAILRWMIDGCLDWQNEGLLRPTVVTEATKIYFEEQDIFGQWLDECTEYGVFETAERLFKSWTGYAIARGEQIGTSTSFGTKLSQRGFERDQERVGGKVCKIRRGISLILKDKESKPYSD